jgi:hypothetical protein
VAVELTPTHEAQRARNVENEQTGKKLRKVNMLSEADVPLSF